MSTMQLLIICVTAVLLASITSATIQGRRDKRRNDQQ